MKGNNIAKSSSHYFISLMWGVLLCGLFNQCAWAQDPVKVAPKNVKVVLENDRVRVIEVWLKPGEKIPMHSHPANVTIALSNFKGRWVSSEGETTIRPYKLDSVVWSEPITHASENVGSSEIHAIAIELKDPPRKKKPASR